MPSSHFIAQSFASLEAGATRGRAQAGPATARRSRVRLRRAGR